MIRRHSTLALPKHGASRAQYEDASYGPVVTGSETRLAIADGATESAFSGLWARLLVQEACRAPLAEAIPAARAAFASAAASRGASLPWYAEAKAAEGAHATVLGVTLHRDGALRADAVGDCILFHIRNGETRLAWPLSDPADFDNRPDLVASGEGVSVPEASSLDDRWKSGDRLVLATDAIAAYLLATDPLAALDLDQDGFENLVQTGRQQGMRNDDVTLIEAVLQ